MRRLRKGEFYYMPYFGCREFSAHFALCEEEEIHTAYDVVEEKDLGIMLFDMDYSDPENIHLCFPGNNASRRGGSERLRGAAMILQALVKYYENLAEQGKVSRLGWCHAKVSYEINLSSEGDIIGITSRKIADMRGKK